MVTSDDDHLLCVGACGYSIPSSPGYAYVNGTGRTNEHHSFHLNLKEGEGVWNGVSKPPTTCVVDTGRKRTLV